MSNKEELPEIMDNVNFLLYSQLPLSIDILLFTSGFIAYFKLHSFLLEDNPKLRIFFSFLAHKAVTQFPVLLVCSVFILCLPLMGEGPIFLVVREYSLHFSDSLATTFTYTQNFMENSVFHWIWFLSVEMQVFVLYLGTACLFRNNPKFKWSVIVFFTVSSLLSVFSISLAFKFKMFYNFSAQKNRFAFEEGQYIELLYQNSFVRAWPFFLGTIIAKLYSTKPKIMKTLFMERQNKAELLSRSSSLDSGLSEEELSFTEVIAESKALGVFFLLVGLSLMIYPLAAQFIFTNSDNAFVNTFSTTFDSLIFIIGLSFSLLVISVDYFKGLRHLFDNNIFYTLSNSHYSLFLLTPVVIMLYLCSQQTYIYFSFGDFFLRIFGIIVFSCILSVFVTIIVHLPFKLFMNKIAFKGMKKVI